MKVYVLNLFNLGLTEFTEFDYNSVADFNGETILLSDTGVYKLDKAVAVNFSFSLGYIPLILDEQKQVVDIPIYTHDTYINRTPISEINFKVTSLEGVIANYSLPSNTVKANLGKGHKSTMFKYTVSGNVVATNFTGIKINLLPSKRNV